MDQVLAFALSALGSVPGLIAAGADALALVKHARDAVNLMQAEGRGPSGIEWATLDDTVNGLMGQLKD